MSPHTQLYSTVRCGAVRCGAVRCGAVRYGTVRYGTVRYGTVRYSTIRCHNTVYACKQYNTNHPIMETKNLGTVFGHQVRFQNRIV